MENKNTHKNALITHFVAGYPDMKSSLEIGRGLIEGGAAALEIQFPFSDPSADGPIIEFACRQALEAGFKVQEGFNLIQSLIEESDTPVYIMSYGSILFRLGIENFILKAKSLGVKGLIIPDLIPGSDEGLYRIGREAGIEIVPVIVPTVTEERVSRIMEEKPAWIYTALRAGITGKYTTIDQSNLDFLNNLKSFKVKVMAGFGIRSKEQIELLSPHCDASIVGTFILESMNTAIEKKIPLKEAAHAVVKALI
ncbi:MAG: tryptophan synthase subunit alpha [Spirochaetales bacterium]|nr:tryptophan synthase subunit alpha [Spirochaetales bacterium]